MTPLHSIPPPEHVTAAHGLLASPDWWVWLAYALVLALAVLCMPTGLLGSIKALWEPWGRWIARLSCLSAILDGLIVFTCCFGVVAVWCGWLVPVVDGPKPLRGYRTADDGYVYSAGT